MERHDTDPVALFFGLVFLVAGSLFFFGAEVGSMSPDWVLPSALVGLGMIVAAVTLSLASRGSRAAAAASSATADVPAAGPATITANDTNTGDTNTDDTV